MNEKVTLTPQEATEIFRAAGVRMSPVTLQEGLKDGKFPFGLAIERDTWVYIIWRIPMLEYLRKNGANVDAI